MQIYSYVPGVVCKKKFGTNAKGFPQEHIYEIN